MIWGRLVFAASLQNRVVKKSSDCPDVQRNFTSHESQFRFQVEKTLKLLKHRGCWHKHLLAFKVKALGKQFSE